jgi:hypothetical protein
MSQVGAIAANLHEGSRSEYLAQYVFSSFGTAVSVPHQEDHGVDFYCTLTERIGQRAWAKESYTVQIKSGYLPWIFRSRESIKWLIEYPLPLFLGVVDKKASKLHVYHTAPRFYTWGLGKFPDSLELIPTQETEGQSTQWYGEFKFSLVPILDIEVARLGDDDYWRNARSVLEFWIENETKNLTRVRSGLHIWEMPSKYETNVVPGGGRVQQWLYKPSEELLHIAIRHLSECLECIGSQLDATGEFKAAVLIGLLYRYMHQKFSVFSDDKNATGKLTFLFHNLLDRLPENERTYVFAGIDKIQATVDTLLEDTFRN